MFLHTYFPKPVLLNLGPIKIYWYGFLIAAGVITAFLVTDRLLKKYRRVLNTDDDKLFIDLFDLSLYLLIGGLIGARLFHIIAEWHYYIVRPLEIFKIWNGGLWIYGAIYGGFAGLLMYARKNNFPKNKINFLLDLLAPGVVFAQAIGRWGNYFNQELYGLPVKWGIPISSASRMSGFYNFTHFHPMFLYESLWCLLVGYILLRMHVKFYTKLGGAENRDVQQQLIANKHGYIFLWYIFLYSFGRVMFEFLRIDTVPLIFGIRSTQVVAILFLALAGVLLFRSRGLEKS